jgi:hypothetical protein
MGKTVIAKRQLISGHEPQTRHDTKADWLTVTTWHQETVNCYTQHEMI